MPAGIISLLTENESSILDIPIVETVVDCDDIPCNCNCDCYDCVAPD